MQSSWKRARAAAKLEHFTLHDIRATGLTLAAQSGATLPELMALGGHTTSRATLIYQRAAAERADVVANNMDACVERPRRGLSGSIENALSASSAGRSRLRHSGRLSS